PRRRRRRRGDADAADVNGAAAAPRVTNSLAAPGRRPRARSTPSSGRTAATVLAVAFSPDGKTLAVGCEDQTVSLCAMATGKELAAFTGHKGVVLPSRSVPMVAGRTGPAPALPGSPPGRRHRGPTNPAPAIREKVPFGKERRHRTGL